jgi:hypothetical protein
MEIPGDGKVKIGRGKTQINADPFLEWCKSVSVDIRITSLHILSDIPVLFKPKNLRLKISYL